jgi:hypothetical protein
VKRVADSRFAYQALEDWGGSATVLEELNDPLMVLGRFTSLEGSQISASAKFWIPLARIEPIFSGRKLTNHDALHGLADLK